MSDLRRQYWEDRFQDKNLPPSYRENTDIAETDEEMQKILDECEEEDEELDEITD